MRRAWPLLWAAAASSCLAIDPLDGDYRVAANDEDSSCDEQTPGTCGAVWSDRYGGEVAVEVGGLATRDNGSLYVVGAFSGELALGSTTVAADDADVFLLRLNNDGGAPFAASWPRAGFERPTAIAVTDQLVVVAGHYGAGFSGCSTPGDSGLFVSFANPDSLVAETTFCLPGGGEAEVSGAIVDGDVVRVVGTFDAPLTVGDVTLEPDELDGFVVTIPHGASVPLAAPVHIAGAAEQSVPAIVGLPGGGFAIAGESDGPFAIATLGPQETEEADAFLAVFDADGEPLTLRTWGGPGDQAFTALAADASNVFVAGEVDEGVISLGDHEVRSPADDAVGAFVAAYALDDLEAPLWLTMFAAEDLDVSHLAVTEAAVYVGGTGDGTIRFEAGASFGGACVDLFVARLDRRDGHLTATTRCGDQGEQRLEGLAVHRDDDEAFFAASFEGRVELDQSHEASGKTRDLLVAQVADGSE